MWPSKKTKVCKVNESCSIADDDDDGVCLYAWTHVDGRGIIDSVGKCQSVNTRGHITIPLVGSLGRPRRQR